MVTTNRAGEAATKSGQLSAELRALERLQRLHFSLGNAVCQDFRSLSQFQVFPVALVAHTAADFLFFCLGEFRDREHISVATALDDVLGDPFKLLEELLAVWEDDGPGG